MVKSRWSGEGGVHQTKLMCAIGERAESATERMSIFRRWCWFFVAIDGDNSQQQGVAPCAWKTDLASSAGIDTCRIPRGPGLTAQNHFGVLQESSGASILASRRWPGRNTLMRRVKRTQSNDCVTRRKNRNTQRLYYCSVRIYDVQDHCKLAAARK